MALVYGKTSNGSLKPVAVDDNGNMAVSLGTRISGEQISLDRLFVAEVYDFGGGNVSGSTTDVTLKSGSGVLGQAQVLVPGSGVVAEFYDVSPTDNRVLLGVLPCDTRGTTIYFRRPFTNSLVVKFTGGNASGVTIAVGRL
jgi:hypothetical protein